MEDQSRLVHGQDFGSFLYMDRRHSVKDRDNDMEVFLTVRQKKLLDFFIMHIGEVLEKEAIAKALYEDKESLTSLQLQFGVSKYIEGLRETIGDKTDEAGDYGIIELVRGVGYRFNAPQPLSF